jgi:hypothetical protein
MLSFFILTQHIRRSTILFLTFIITSTLPILVAEPFKAWVYGRPFAGIVGSKPPGDMDVFVVCCQVGVSATG